MGISCSCYSILLREKVTCLTSGCDKARNVSKLPAFSAIELRRIILPLTPERGIHIMPPVNTTRFTLRGYSSAGRALAWHARGHRFDSGNLHQKEKHCTGMCGAFLLCLPSYAAAKFMLDICGKLWYNSFCNCGYSTSASISAFQAEEVGSIPITRSKRPEP